MSEANMKTMNWMARFLLSTVLPMAFAAAAQATSPGITGPSFTLTAGPSYLTQPDGASVYSWGYGCSTPGTGHTFSPPASLMPGATCPSMQVPGPTLIVNEGDTVTVTLRNNLPPAAGNTSILFPGFNVTASTGVQANALCSLPGAATSQGILTTEAKHGCSVTYTFVASTPGTRAYYSGTQADLQVEMGLYGAIVVLPSATPSACKANGGFAGANGIAESHWGEQDFRLAASAYDHPGTCYDREYMFQFSEMDPNIHSQALAQVTAGATSLQVPTEPYHPAYFLINGRSMPDDMDPNYAAEYPHQPYNGNPHMHPGEQVLLRIIGQGRWQHPFHEHGNHVRILARDGNLILSPTTISYGAASAPALAGPALFTTTTTPGLAMDGIYYWTGKGLNWDPYGHNTTSADPNAKLTCTADANGYNTSAPTAINYYEWCQDHDKPLEVNPFGDVGTGGPATLPDSNILTNGAWYSGSPYLGPDATTRAVGGSCTAGYPAVVNSGCTTTGTTPPSGTVANSPSQEAGFAFMWHSHNEREITTNNIFPGGMLMMMLVDSREFQIDESN